MNEGVALGTGRVGSYSLLYLDVRHSIIIVTSKGQSSRSLGTKM